MTPLSTREHGVGDYIPQSSHITSDTIITRDGDLQRTWRISGIPFETAEPAELERRKEDMSRLLRTVGSQRVAIWQHTVQRKATVEWPRDYRNGWCGQYHRDYVGSLGEMLITELYVTVVYRIAPTRAERLLLRAGRRRPRAILRERERTLTKLDEIAGRIESELKPYAPTVLSMYTNSRGALCSEPLSFLNFLITGQWQPVRAPYGPIYDAIGNAWIHAGTEAIEVRTPLQRRYAQVVDIKEYAEHTEPGILDGLLYHAREFVLTQSFSIHHKRDAKAVLKRQRTHLLNSEDGSASQIEEMDEAIDELDSGGFCMGEYHMTLALFGDTREDVAEGMQDAITELSHQGFIVALQTTATEAAWLAQLPANWSLRPRVAHLTSRNYAGLAGLHNFPHGRAAGNPWGEALTVLSTPSGQRFYFSFHPPSGQDDTGKTVLGHARVIGRSRTGKTTFDNHVLAQAQAIPGLRTIVFDKDHSARETIRAMNGEYLTIALGEPSGLNPLQLDPTPGNLSFLYEFVRVLARQDGHALSSTDEQRIDRAIRTVMDMPRELRRLSVLVQNITEGFGEARETSVVKRLAKWCADDGAGRRGAYAWAFDNEDDRIDLTTNPVHGIDGTQWLDEPTVSGPITMYLLHRMRGLLDGRPLICHMEEGWQWLNNEAITAWAGDLLLTAGKKNGVVVFTTQQPSSVLRSAIATELVEQIATEVYLPNPRARHDEYVDGFGLTEAEFRIVNSFPDDSRLCLIKQGDRSVVARLDLSGCTEYLDILSGRVEPVEPAQEAVA